MRVSDLIVMRRYSHSVFAVVIATALPLMANHLGRVVMQQDVIPAAVAGNSAFQYQCIAQGQGGSGYNYVCNPPSCIMPAGMGIDGAGNITVTDPSQVTPGVKKVTLTLQAAE